jgi:hypothetical protein
MHCTVYFLAHRDSGERSHYYKTRAAARIAQRARNRLLGFTDRLERCEVSDNWEVERCELATGEIVDATWVIVEDTVDVVEMETFSQ